MNNEYENRNNAVIALVGLIIISVALGATYYYMDNIENHILCEGPVSKGSELYYYKD